MYLLAACTRRYDLLVRREGHVQARDSGSGGLNKLQGSVGVAGMTLTIVTFVVLLCTLLVLLYFFYYPMG